MKSPIEQVAIAIWDAVSPGFDWKFALRNDKKKFRRMARAAIRAERKSRRPKR